MTVNNKQNLNFDVYQRFNGIKNTLTLLGLPSDAKILDVGGYPGRFADFLHPADVSIVDLPDCDRKNYFKASGVNLPFSDASFNAVVSSDTIEHISAAEREKFVKELLRVSSDSVIIGAPFKSPSVECAEKTISDVYSAIESGVHPWLAEHISKGLPELNETSKIFADNNCPLRIIPNGNLFNWFLLEFIENISRGFADIEMICRDSMQILNSMDIVLNNSVPAYRMILAARKNGKFSDALLSASFEINSKQFASSEDDLNKIRNLSEVFIKIANQISIQKKSDTAGGDALSRAVLERLQKAISAQTVSINAKDAEIKKLKERLMNIEKSRAYKLFKKIF